MKGVGWEEEGSVIQFYELSLGPHVLAIPGQVDV